jgi:hypothetical protein
VSQAGGGGEQVYSCKSPDVDRRPTFFLAVVEQGVQSVLDLRLRKRWPLLPLEAPSNLD